MKDIIPVMIFFGLGCIGGFQLGCMYNSNNLRSREMINADIKMSADKDIDTLQKLYSLREFIKTLDIYKSCKEEILKKIDFEIQFVERDVFMELGRKSYFELQKDKVK